MFCFASTSKSNIFSFLGLLFLLFGESAAAAAAAVKCGDGAERGPNAGDASGDIFCEAVERVEYASEGVLVAAAAPAAPPMAAAWRARC